MSSAARIRALPLFLLLGWAPWAAAQDAAKDDPWKIVMSQLQELRGELAASRQETKDLRREIEQLREQIASQGSAAPQSQPSADTLAEDQRLIEAKVSELEQTKVSSGSKYHVRLSGLALFNTFRAGGAVDNSDLPKFASTDPAQSRSSIGASLRQSMISLEVFGPEWKGARTRGDVTFDFFGGFPSTSEGIANGLVRLRTANLALEWKNVSVIAGQDTPFFSPLSPSSLVSSAYPALSSAGNLWTWTPQIYVEQRKTLANDSQLSLRWGVLDPLTGEPPAAEYNRMPTAGEHSGQPAYAAHAAWQRNQDDRPLSFGLGGYFSKQHWGFERNVNAWAATADWNIPMGPWFSLSGELYRGRAIAGLGGGASGSVLFLGPANQASSSVLALDSAGGWSQFKFKPRERLEFNAAFGEDKPFRSGLTRAAIAQAGADSVPSRNSSGYLNTILHARSNLLFSLEYRRLWTSYFGSPKRTADYVALGAGIVF